MALNGVNGHPPLTNGIVSEGVGISGRDSGYATKVQKLIQLIDDLRALGAEAVLELPGITVIGNQSAGKSSLVEAVSGITVPRSSGTCTRCPMECRLKHSSKPWTCQVRLRRKRDTDLDADLGGPHSSKNGREEPFGPLIEDITQLEIMIRRAQLAILNPVVPASRFVDYTEQEIDDYAKNSDDQLQFSQDVVCLDISGPNVTNLSFIDLPGIISYDDQDNLNVELVENMVRDHIHGNSLILLTITMREEFQLQKAAGLAKEADPLGQRTIGVLTKPDTLQDGEEDFWLEVLEGRGVAGNKHKLHHGYFITKQPSPSELKEKLEHSAARERERQFFETTHPWKGVEKRIRDRMGVPKLTVELSRLLSQLIEKTLPKLRKNAQDSLAATSKALKELPPPPPDNAIIELTKLINGFSTDVEKCIWGRVGSEDLSQHCRAAYEEFRVDILSTGPNYILKERPRCCYGDSTKTSPSADENEEGSTDVQSGREPVYIDDLHDFLDKSLTRELPLNVPYSAKAKLIQEGFEDWPIYCLKCFKSVRDELQKHLSALKNSHFNRYTRGNLKEHVWRIIEKELDACIQLTTNHMNWLVELESPPFTKNDHYYSDCREKFLAEYKEKRQAKSFNFSFSQDDVNEALAALARIGKAGLKEADLAKLVKSDPYEQELIVMAEVSAYFRVAYKRIIDNLPRVIDHDFLQGFNRRILEALTKGLGVGEKDAMDRAENYLKDEPEIVAQREELTRKKERLEEIVDRLDRFYI